MEVWCEIPGYEGYYIISNLGIVSGLKRTVAVCNGTFRRINARSVETRINNDGYLQVRLSKDNITRTLSIHRLIAQAFIANPENKAEVNHIDGNKMNNAIENLEWCTRSENVKHAYDIGLFLNKGVNRQQKTLLVYSHN